MATAIRKIAQLSTTREIPFNKLVLSQSNVRRTKAGVSVEDLAEDIARRGLMQNLNVRPVLDTERVETGMFEVPAGGRRFRALELLVKVKRLAKTAPVPCNVREADSSISAEEDSLAENTQREALHPLDQFRAFAALIEKGLSEEEIAARFFVPVTVVRQRLKLASVAPALLDVYSQDGMTLEQLMAFTVTADHARQLQVWEALQRSYNREAYYIRRALTEGAVPAHDRRAIFVGVAAYEAAGGVVARDLFSAQDNGGWLEDAALIDRLATERLAREAEAVGAEGWKWVEANIGFPYGHTAGLRRFCGKSEPLTDEEQASLAALTDEYECLYAEHEGEDDFPEEVDARLGEIETALEALQRPAVYDAADVARGGAFVSIDGQGALKVERGFIRPEDEVPEPRTEPQPDSADEGHGTAPNAGSSSGPTITVGGQPADVEEDEDAIRPLPDRLLTELTAHRTLALRNALAANPRVAMTALLHKLVVDTFGHRSSTGCLEVQVRQVYFGVQDDGLKHSASAKAVSERHEGWKADLPADDDALWTWIDVLDEPSRASLLAHCVSFGVNALFERGDRYGPGISAHGVQQRLVQADRLARAVRLDMVEAGWQPTANNYLGRVTKARILEAVREGKGEQAAQLIEHLKKGDMAREAERLLTESGWLPEPLRTPGTEEPAATDAGHSEAEPLPAFLADGEDPAVDGDLEPEPFAVAAE